jgi:hypothetical protein
MLKLKAKWIELTTDLSYLLIQTNKFTIYLKKITYIKRRVFTSESIYSYFYISWNIAAIISNC